MSPYDSTHSLFKTSSFIMTFTYLALIGAAVTASGVTGYQLGVDLSVATSAEQWDCLSTTANVTYGLVKWKYF